MPFIGKNPTAGFASIVKDTFTPNGSATTFTLSKQVANANDIAVFVGNVRQQPTTAYTVNGTTLDFGSGNAPASGLDMYVLHIAGTLESSVIPADGTISSAKIQSNAVTSAKLDTNIAVSGNLDVGTVRSASGNSALTIDSSGRVFRPALPSWNLMGIPNAPSAGNQYIFGSGGASDDEGDDFEIDLSKVQLSNPNYFADRMNKRDKSLFVFSTDDKKYKAYSRMCPSSARRQPVILTESEKNKIDNSFINYLVSNLLQILVPSSRESLTTCLNKLQLLCLQFVKFYTM